VRFGMISTPLGRALVVALKDGSHCGHLVGQVSGLRDLDDIVQSGEPLSEGLFNVLARGRSFEAGTYSLLPPLQRPRKILCIGLNYLDHTKESNFEQPDYPTVFARFSSGLVGHNGEFGYSSLSPTLDYEGELVAVIGRTAKRVSKDQASAHIVAYSIFNDGSVREYQHRTPQWTVGKNFDATGGFGPYLVTADELPEGGRGLKIETRLNGTTVQSSNTSKMIFDVPTLISVLSQALTLEPGDVLVTGTPAGVGASRKPPLYMKPGDVCEVEIERVGLLRNTVGPAE
jgi:acylpyruvate hydrolase